MAQAANAATQLAVEISNIIGMSEEALKAQLGIDMTDIAKQFGKDYVNAPLVVQNVGVPCKAMLEHPMKRMARWLQVERKKHASQ